MIVRSRFRKLGVKRIHRAFVVSVVSPTTKASHYDPFFEGTMVKPFSEKTPFKVDEKVLAEMRELVSKNDVHILTGANVLKDRHLPLTVFAQGNHHLSTMTIHMLKERMDRSDAPLLCYVDTEAAIDFDAVTKALEAKIG